MSLSCYFGRYSRTLSIWSSSYWNISQSSIDCSSFMSMFKSFKSAINGYYLTVLAIYSSSSCIFLLKLSTTDYIFLISVSFVLSRCWDCDFRCLFDVSLFSWYSILSISLDSLLVMLNSSSLVWLIVRNVFSTYLASSPVSDSIFLNVMMTGLSYSFLCVLLIP